MSYQYKYLLILACIVKKNLVEILRYVNKIKNKEKIYHTVGKYNVFTRRPFSLNQ